ncbi:hypothetical protein CV014_13545 [Nostoc sp. CMAA1605]|nr:hypothetical protein [Nostoc sp. CMAA1605]
MDWIQSKIQNPKSKIPSPQSLIPNPQSPVTRNNTETFTTQIFCVIYPINSRFFKGFGMASEEIHKHHIKLYLKSWCLLCP